MSAVDLRYARALSQVVDEQKLDAAAVTAQLNEFVVLLGESPELHEVLLNPSIQEAQKLNVLDAISARNGMSKAVRNFVALVAKHDRLGELSDMASAFHSISDAEGGIAEAEVVSAHPLDEANRRLIEQKIADMTGERVSATYSQDASLLGGAIVKVGSTVYDGSVRAQLQMLKQRMVGAVS